MQAPIVVAFELWTLLLVIWVVGTFTVKRVARRERAWTRIAQLLMLATAFELMFDPRLMFWFLGWRMFKPSYAVGWVGVWWWGSRGQLDCDELAGKMAH